MKSYQSYVISSKIVSFIRKYRHMVIQQYKDEAKREVSDRDVLLENVDNEHRHDLGGG